jgi:hypothetical protein
VDLFDSIGILIFIFLKEVLMESFSFIVFCIFILYLQLRLSRRVWQCERLLKELQGAPEVEKQMVEEKIVEREFRPKPAAPTFTEVAEKPAKKPEVPQLPAKKWPSLRIPAGIKENWMGLFGSLALVVGAVFFGLTSEIMKLAEARVGLMLLFSMLLLFISRRIKSQQPDRLSYPRD